MSLTRALIVDMDNTMSINVSGRRWYGEGFEDRLHEDEVNRTLNEVLSHLVDQNEDWPAFADHILFVSGRAEAGREATTLWLNDDAGWGTAQDRYTLLMRRDKDFRRDVVVKREIYYQHIKDKYNVVLALDDKPEIVALWRDLGIDCWQVREYE